MKRSLGSQAFNPLQHHCQVTPGTALTLALRPYNQPVTRQWKTSGLRAGPQGPPAPHSEPRPTPLPGLTGSSGLGLKSTPTRVASVAQASTTCQGPSYFTFPMGDKGRTQDPQLSVLGSDKILPRRGYQAILAASKATTGRALPLLSAESDSVPGAPCQPT